MITAAIARRVEKHLVQRGLLGESAPADLDPLEARTVIEQGQYRDAVDRDWQRSRHMGISAVPTFVINRQRMVGAQAYQDLTRFIQSEV